MHQRRYCAGRAAMSRRLPPDRADEAATARHPWRSLAARPSEQHLGQVPVVLRFTADDAVAMAADYVCEASLTRSSVVSKLYDSLNDREAHSATALDPRDRHQTTSTPHP